MIDSEVYLEAKETQINMWITQLALLDALSLEAGEDVVIEFENQLKVFGENLNELNNMFLNARNLNESGKDTFRQLIEGNWGELEENFNRSIAEYERLIRARIED